MRRTKEIPVTITFSGSRCSSTCVFCRYLDANNQHIAYYLCVYYHKELGYVLENLERCKQCIKQFGN